MEYVKTVFKDTPKTFKTIEEILGKARGASGVPLNYAISNGLSPADESDNPGSNYTSKDAEIIAREPFVLELGVGHE